MTSPTVLLIESQTPAAPSTDITTATATTVTMPNAIDSRNDVFITDQGSRWTSRRRALRVPRGRAAVERTGAEDDEPGDVRPEVGVEDEPERTLGVSPVGRAVEEAADCTALPAADT